MLTIEKCFYWTFAVGSPSSSYVQSGNKSTPHWSHSPNRQALACHSKNPSRGHNIASYNSIVPAYVKNGAIQVQSPSPSGRQPHKNSYSFGSYANLT
jgi:hypothetical protein